MCWKIRESAGLWEGLSIWEGVLKSVSLDGIVGKLAIAKHQGIELGKQCTTLYPCSLSIFESYGRSRSYSIGSSESCVTCGMHLLNVLLGIC